jgi:hypothetical protein
MTNFNNEWVTSIYENCAGTMETLQLKEEELTPEEQGLSNLCEVVVYLYTELYEDPCYVTSEGAADRRVLH